MKKIDSFVTTSVANSLINMSDNQLQEIASLIANFPAGEKLGNYIDYAILDRQICAIEVQEPEC